MRVCFDGKGGILALDLGSRLGWAVTQRQGVADWPRTHLDWTAFNGDQAVRYGSQQIGQSAPGQLGAFLASFEAWLCDMITVHDPKVLCWEATLSSGQFSSQAAALKLMGLAALCEFVAYRRDLRTYMGHIHSCKKQWTGDGRAKKPAMIAAARDRGFNRTCLDEHAADALAVLHLTILKNDLQPLAAGKDQS